MTQTYAGELKPQEAWELLKSDHSAQLVDVRTQAEWSFVGVADLSSLGRQPLLVSWQVFPTMAKNEQFAAQLAAQGVKPEQPLLFLCRSGVRSLAAAELMTAQGYTKCYNVTDGFEGPLDGSRHRGLAAGWKASSLPWVQG
jgi:rhodanese-related sulfurtransferase